MSLFMSFSTFIMKIFDRNKRLNFSDENIESLSESILVLKDVMMEIGVSNSSNELNSILASAMKKNSKSFIKHTLTNNLFGGSGAIWEIDCRNDILQAKFEKRFVNFCMELKNIGINNDRINQVIKSLK